MNHVRLFSNGTAVIDRKYEVDKKLDISIPVRKNDLDEVLASFQIFGKDATFTCPLYTPNNVNPTSLKIDSNNVIKSLATSLSGSEVSLTIFGEAEKINGKLVGIQTFQKYHNNVLIDGYKIVVSVPYYGIRTYEDNRIQYFNFTEESIKSEIDKALKQQYENIKPDSSIINLTVFSKEKTNVTISYATPCAAWKIRYQLRLDSNLLYGQAIVDNDTDDDWKDTIISVITGDPIVFSTDLAEIRRPIRERVNVVSDKAIGVVKPASIKAIRARKSVGTSHNMMAIACSTEGTTVCDFSEEVAYQPEAEIEESGDFSVFTSPNKVDIPSKKSAIVHLFNSELKNAKDVLYYKNGNSPYKTIRFKNETGFFLGKGVCEIFQKDNIFQGKAILENCQLGDDIFLVYAKDNKVKITAEAQPTENRVIFVNFDKGNCFYENCVVNRTVYTINGNEDIPLEIDYTRSNFGSKITVKDYETIETTNGVRILTHAKSSTIEVVETVINQVNAGFVDSIWIRNYLINLTNSVQDNPTISSIFKIQDKINEVNVSKNELQSQAREIDKEQKRLNELIPNLHPEQANIYRTDLANNEKELRNLNRVEIPKLDKDISSLFNQIKELILSLSFSWKEDNGQ